MATQNPASLPIGKRPSQIVLGHTQGDHSVVDDDGVALHAHAVTGHGGDALYKGDVQRDITAFRRQTCNGRGRFRQNQIPVANRLRGKNAVKADRRAGRRVPDQEGMLRITDAE